jgi:hypothetical protein
MAKDRRTLQDCIEMAADLAEAMGSKLVKHPSDGAELEAGYCLENYNPGAPFAKTALLIRVDEQGRRYYPFGNVGLSYADFWQAGCFALKCLDESQERQKRAIPTMVLGYRKRDWERIESELSERDDVAVTAVIHHAIAQATELTWLKITLSQDQAREVVKSAARLGIA